MNLVVYLLLYALCGALYLGSILGCTVGGIWLSGKLVGNEVPGFLIGMFVGVLVPFYGDLFSVVRSLGRRLRRPREVGREPESPRSEPESPKISGELESAVSVHLAELVARFEGAGSETGVSFRNPDPSLRAGTVRFGLRRSKEAAWAFDVEVESPVVEGNSSETTQALGSKQAMLATLRDYASDPSELVTVLRELALSLYKFEHPYTGDEQRQGAIVAARQEGKWKLVGYDTFASEWYGLGGEFDDEESASEAARRRLAELETLQPTSSSGGQDPDGIQDRVYIVSPDGSSYRYT